jgi:hypothetical protein
MNVVADFREGQVSNPALASRMNSLDRKLGSEICTNEPTGEGCIHEVLVLLEIPESLVGLQ